MTVEEFKKRSWDIISPMDITVISIMVREFFTVPANQDSLLKNTTSRIVDKKLDEVTNEDMKEVVIMLSLYMSCHITNSLTFHNN